MQHFGRDIPQKKWHYTYDYLSFLQQHFEAIWLSPDAPEPQKVIRANMYSINI